ncbi:MAG: hypothetical protein ACT4QE_04600 [Anaerolineales bacterium]
MLARHHLWFPLLLTLGAILACGLAFFRQIGPWELGIVLAPLALVFVVESARYIARRFLAGYRRRPPSG